MEQQKREVETAKESTHVSDRLNADGECEAAATDKSRCGWAKQRVCGKLLYRKRFPLKLKQAVYKSCERPVILYESET